MSRTMDSARRGRSNAAPSGASLDEIAGGAPLVVFVEHQGNRLDGIVSVFEAGGVLDNDVLAGGRVWGRVLVFGGGEFAGDNFTEGRAHGGQLINPLGSTDRGFERCRSLIPALRIFSRIGEGQPGFRGFLSEFFGLLLGLGYGRLVPQREQEEDRQKRCC